ncbi:MAG: hypothetical protein F4Y02_11740 [Chloroflexi bacterium]|nr:hypothetical protein [Chloroflexota bacterium]
MRLDLSFEPDLFAAQLAHEIAAGGLTVVDAIERLFSERLENALTYCLGDRIVKAPQSFVHPAYYANRFQNLAAFSRTGYCTWYPEVRFSTCKNDIVHISQLRASGIHLGSIRYGGVERHYTHKVKELKTQVNHSFRLNEVKISPDVFVQSVRNLEESCRLSQPYMANLTVGFERFVDDRVQGFRTVSFDHVVTGDRYFCACHFDAHAAMLSDARNRLSNFVSGSWPHRVVSLLEGARYMEGACHFCVAEQHGKNAPVERYGSQVRRHYQPYVDLLVRGRAMDRRTAKAETMRRLSISRWVREDELYDAIRKLFPKRTIRREASPVWLGQQRLDIYLPELALSLEHQGEQHFFPIEAFGGESALEKTRERDRRKRALCKEHGVTVVDVRFDDPITMPSLRKRLQRWLR